MPLAELGAAPRADRAPHLPPRATLRRGVGVACRAAAGIAWLCAAAGSPPRPNGGQPLMLALPCLPNWCS